MFGNGFVERHDLEQYFWTTTTVHKLRKAFSFNPDLCCLATPSLAHACHDVEEEPRQDVRLLDIDTRFSYLPGFRFWDIRHPEPLAEMFRVVVFDPPFFYIPMDELCAAVLEVCKGDTSTKLLIGFLVREEASSLTAFKEFRLVRTKFVLEYEQVAELCALQQCRLAWHQAHSIIEGVKVTLWVSLGGKLGTVSSSQQPVVGGGGRPPAAYFEIPPSLSHL